MTISGSEDELSVDFFAVVADDPSVALPALLVDHPQHAGGLLYCLAVPPKKLLLELLHMAFLTLIYLSVSTVWETSLFWLYIIAMFRLSLSS